MKKLILLILLPMLLSAQGDLAVKSNYEWLTNYEIALKKAEKEQKKILVFFTGSDWCRPCIALKKDFFETPAFNEYIDKYVLLYIDIPRNRSILSEEQLTQNKELASKLNKKGSVPMLKIINEDGREIDKLSGYNMNGDTKYHIRFLDKNLK
tara:strand:- start:3201 stop:3656 length:456 start_codon:yes stop_codon:yes gene_type:complete